VHAAGLDLRHEEHVQALDEHGVNVQEVGCRSLLLLIRLAATQAGVIPRPW
jgi:hypothetical protein